MHPKIRNVAIIAHVDHGKTTLIDGLFKEAGEVKGHQILSDRVMDSGDLERERGITITAKNASVTWKGVKINIIDTPGHADFGGEVERALFMADGAILLVDAAEGPLPQTRFVLKKALDRNLKIIVIINKVDRPDARIEEVEEKLLELFYELATDSDHVEFKTLYASAKERRASLVIDEPGTTLAPILDTILKEMPAPKAVSTGPFKMLVANRAYSAFLGPIAIGRLESGEIKEGDKAMLWGESGKKTPFSITSLEGYSGLKTQKVKTLGTGDIALVAGAADVQIGDTISATDATEPLTRLEVDPPSVAIRLSVNTSPFAGQEGNYVTSRKFDELLSIACQKNVALKVEQGDTPEVFILKARGELQIVILLEELRREGYEFMAGRPEILPQKFDGVMMEPEERMVIDIPDDLVGTVTELMATRKGRMENMEVLSDSGRTRLEFVVPARGLIGIRSIMLTKTRGEAIFSSSHEGYIPYQGKRFSRQNGALVVDRNGTTAEYGLYHLESRGQLFIKEGTAVYEGMVFGENARKNDMNANPTKEKKLTNMRASGKDESTKLAPIKFMDLDQALEWIDEDEWVEITPETIRVRKSELRTAFRKVIRN